MVPRTDVPSIRRRRDRTAWVQVPAPRERSHRTVPIRRQAYRRPAEIVDESVSTVFSYGTTLFMDIGRSPRPEKGASCRVRLGNDRCAELGLDHSPIDCGPSILDY